MRLAVITAALAVTAAPAFAQRADTPRARVSINAAIQAGGDTIQQSFSVTKNVEAAPVSVSIPAKTAPTFDAGLALRLNGRFSVGFTISHASKALGGSVSAQIPHPFYYDQPRAIAGATAGLTHSETAVHIAAIYTIPASPSFEVSVFGGPTVFSVAQSLVSDVAYTESYPFDSATFASATTTGARATTIGFHAGTDLTWRLGRHVGVGGLLRYSRASVTLSAGPTNSADARAGGVLTGGGIRLWF